jgi:hypothetical protein
MCDNYVLHCTVTKKTLIYFTLDTVRVDSGDLSEWLPTIVLKYMCIVRTIGITKF